VRAQHDEAREAEARRPRCAGGPRPALTPRPLPAPAVPASPQMLPEECYLIGCDGPEASGDQASAQTMGFKAWNLLRMDRLGLPVPPAFVLGTRYCQAESVGTEVWRPGLGRLEQAAGARLGDPRRPLLLSVRSGAPVSMPGMMETLLNVGLCDATVGGLTRLTGNPRLVWDAYRRLVATYGEVVAGVPAEAFEEASAALAPGRDERELDFAELRALTRRYLEVYAQVVGRPFPQDPAAQLAGAIAAVFASWQSAKACEYRRLNDIPDGVGTAVTVQAMVFGNGGGRSGSGVGFTRDPATGKPALWVDFLFNAQGEDVVSGRRDAHGHEQLAEVLPATWQALQAAVGRLERALGDMQDFEFTVQDGRLYMLQTRSGKRTPQAAARIALDLWEEGLIPAEEARRRTASLDEASLARTRVVSTDGRALTPAARAATACSGVAIGEIALDEERVAARSRAGAAVILVRRDAETRDIGALEMACGLLTQRGARTAHAAVVARQLGKVCLVGCNALGIDEASRSVTLGEHRLQEGELLTLDGNEGHVYIGAARTVVEPADELLSRLARLRESSEPVAVAPHL
jgi:pyruvate, orthophosphate dikinase